jgi:CIC family chloride channel protein
VAFNAPVGGALFTIEEVTKSFRVRVMLVTLMSTSVAVWVSRFIIPDRPDFAARAVVSPGVSALPAYVVLGLIAGVLGVAYNALVMQLLRRTDRMQLNPTARAAVIGALIGLLLWLDPMAAGGGGQIAQVVLGGQSLSLWALLGLFAVRFVAGPLSYASGTPGGLFAPLLALGALLGAAFHTVALTLGGAAAVDLLGLSPVPFALVGMVALFTASVRAPMTGIVLITEMTATASLTLAMFAAAAAALFMTTALKGRPIYDSLRDRMLERRAAPRAAS